MNCWGSIQKTSCDTLTIILKAVVPYLNKVNLNDLFTLSIGHSIQSIERKNFLRNVVNMALGALVSKQTLRINLDINWILLGTYLL
jgi:hypothetical protein